MNFKFVSTTIVSLLFGATMSMVEPYPCEHDLALFVFGFLAFLLVHRVLRGAPMKQLWMRYGVATVACYAVPFVWFWFCAMPGGLWYPPQPPILQLVMLVDGEGAYDAMVSNLFLVLWLVVSTGFLVFGIMQSQRHDNYLHGQRQ